MCLRAKHACGVCCFSVCHQCYTSKEYEVPRSFVLKKNAEVKHDVSPNTTKHTKCLHGLNDLELAYEPYWIKAKDRKSGLFTWAWFNQVKGCVICKKMYVAMEDKGSTLPMMSAELKSLWPRLDEGCLGASFEEEVQLAKQGGVRKELMMEE